MRIQPKLGISYLSDISIYIITGIKMYLPLKCQTWSFSFAVTIDCFCSDPFSMLIISSDWVLQTSKNSILSAMHFVFEWLNYSWRPTAHAWHVFQTWHVEEINCICEYLNSVTLLILHSLQSRFLVQFMA